MPRPQLSALTGTAELNAMIERVAPDILERHAEDDVALALIRLAVTGRVRETGGKYALAVGEV
jgi:hypothetical protein